MATDVYADGRIFNVQTDCHDVVESGLEEGFFLIGNRITHLFAGMDYDDFWWNEISEVEIPEAAIAVMALNMSRRVNSLENEIA